jgi:hypothetical protein
MMTRRSLLQILAAACAAGTGKMTAVAPALPAAQAPRWFKARPIMLNLWTEPSFICLPDLFGRAYLPLPELRRFGTLDLLGGYLLDSGDTMSVRAKIEEWTFSFDATIKKLSIRGGPLNPPRTRLDFQVQAAPLVNLLPLRQAANHHHYFELVTS